MPKINNFEIANKTRHQPRTPPG